MMPKCPHGEMPSLCPHGCRPMPPIAEDECPLCNHRHEIFRADTWGEITSRPIDVSRGVFEEGVQVKIERADVRTGRLLVIKDQQRCHMWPCQIEPLSLDDQFRKTFEEEQLTWRPTRRHCNVD